MVADKWSFTVYFKCFVLIFSHNMIQRFEISTIFQISKSAPETCKDSQRHVEKGKTPRETWRITILPKTTKDYQSHLEGRPKTPQRPFQRLPKIPKIYRESQYFQRHPETSGAAQGTQHSLGDYKSPRDT
jgi:hypothetical protein